MELPELIREITEELEQKYGISALRAAAEELSLRYRQAARNGASLISTDCQAAAYAISRMPATFGAVYTALKYIGEIVDFGEIHSLCDVGAGTGAATLAATEFVNAENTVCIEREAAMRNLGQRFVNAHWLAADSSAVNQVKADMVISSYMLNEFSPTARLKAVKEMLDAAEKMLVIVENGTPQGYEIINDIREKAAEWGAEIAAPCPNVRLCPIKGGDWCHFTCRVARSKAHKLLKGGDAPYEDEKFCYIALVKQPVTPVSSRVLRHPKIESGKITLTLCCEQGIVEKIQTKKDKAAFKAARKSAAGDSFNF